MVKVVINLKERILQLEGSQEFVEKYLDLYRPDASKWKAVISQEESEQKKKPATKRTRTKAAKPKGAPSCTGRIRTLIDEGYFNEPKTSAEVTNWLKEEKGTTYGTGPVTASLNYLIKSGKLRRFREGKEPYNYCNP